MQYLRVVNVIKRDFIVTQILDIILVIQLFLTLLVASKLFMVKELMKRL